MFSCSIILYSLICTFFIWFPSSFRVIFYLQSLPSSLLYLFFQLFTALYFGPRSLFILCFYEFKFLFSARGSVCPQTLSLFLSMHPSLHPFSLLVPPSLHPSLLSSRPASRLPSVQLRCNPGRQRDSELTAEMRWWNGMTSVVRLCVFLPLRSHLALINFMSTCDCTYRCVCVGVWQKVISASATMLW